MNPLAELQDIHAAPAPGWWPLAPGWWLLLVAVFLLMAIGIYLFRRYRRYKKRVAKQQHILHKFEQTYTNYTESSNIGDLVSHLHQLIRRLMLVSGAQQQVGLIGDDFLAYLDEGLDEKPFTTGIGKVLVSAPYQPEPKVSAKPLYELVYAWAQQQVQKL